MYVDKKECIYCNQPIFEESCVVLACISLNKIEKFEILLQKLSVVLEYSNLTQPLLELCKEISNLKDIMTPLNLVPLNEFNEELHKIDVVAQEYLQKCSGIDEIFVPVDSLGDFNCLYSSVRLLVPHESLSTVELRVRTLVELVLHYNFYNEKYLLRLGELSGSLKDVSIMNRFSDGYEVAALSSILNWEIKLYCPELGYTGGIHKMDIVSPRCCNVANGPVSIIQLLWSHVLPILKATTVNRNGIILWTPNHFVPLLQKIDVVILNNFDGRMYIGSNITFC